MELPQIGHLGILWLVLNIAALGQNISCMEIEVFKEISRVLCKCRGHATRCNLQPHGIRYKNTVCYGFLDICIHSSYILVHLGQQAPCYAQQCPLTSEIPAPEASVCHQINGRHQRLTQLRPRARGQWVHRERGKFPKHAWSNGPLQLPGLPHASQLPSQ